MLKKYIYSRKKRSTFVGRSQNEKERLVRRRKLILAKGFEIWSWLEVETRLDAFLFFTLAEAERRQGFKHYRVLNAATVSRVSCSIVSVVDQGSTDSKDLSSNLAGSCAFTSFLLKALENLAWLEEKWATIFCQEFFSIGHLSLPGDTLTKRVIAFLLVKKRG